MECHRCPHASDVQAGKYKESAFEKTPCAKCELEEDSMFTKEYDEDRAAVDGSAAGEVVADSGGVGVEVMPVDVLSEIVTGLLSLPPAQRDVVCLRHAGLRYKEIAALQGVTTAAAEVRHRRAMRRWPALQAMFARKARKQECRRTHCRRGGRRSRAEQGVAGQ